MVSHNAFIFQLKQIGIGGGFIDILTYFLHGRQQRVLVNGAASDLEPVVFGVPVGSILDPLLFLTYTADLCCNLENKFVQCADDFTLISTICSPEDG